MSKELQNIQIRRFADQTYGPCFDVLIDGRLARGLTRDEALGSAASFVYSPETMPSWFKAVDIDDIKPTEPFIRKVKDELPIEQPEPLMVASPELLAACQMALDSLTFDAHAYEQKYWPEAGPNCLITNLKSAIAKATGEPAT